MLPSFAQSALSRLATSWQARSDSGQLILWLMRGCFGAIIIGMAWVAFVFFNDETDPGRGVIAFAAVLGVGALVMVTDLLVRRKEITTISAIYFGLLMGLLLGTLFSMALEPILPAEWLSTKVEPMKVRSGPPKIDAAGHEVPGSGDVIVYPIYLDKKSDRLQGLRLLITVICCYVSISLLLQTKDEFRFIIPYVEFSKQVKGGRPLVLDTSVIIDGRIADICDTRFIDTKLIVPRFVLQELQGIADSSDKLKRNRGRRGLDMLKRMQNNPKVELQMHEGNLTELRDVHKVDERLVVLAKALGARVVTNDYNLNKIAQLQGVEVINLNELANSMKSVALPGEGLSLRLVKQGDQVGQGVGYLDDGTMVVVEQGRAYIGQEVQITVTSVLQTPAGRMIFGRLDRPGAEAAARGSEGGVVGQRRET
jgi:uncharacterized protein YacL